MTRIIKLELKGFKSFAHKTEIVFGKDYNVIIGPNGSGKSNVLDALCFVLAKSSAKGLRAEKSANLIYNGGKEKKPMKEGSVSIFFDNTDKTFPVDEDVVKVTRVIKESGQSVYKINDKTHTRSEVLELLSLAKVDPDGYNIILQGDIVRFVEMSSLDRRQILEEVAGISVYEEKKDKALRELEKVDKSLSDASIVLSEREHYLKDLKGERDQAIAYKDMDTQLKSSKLTLVCESLHLKQSELESIDKKMGGHQQRIDELDKKISGLRSQVQETKKQITQINDQIEQRGEKEQVALHKEVERLKVDVLTKQQRISDITKEIERIQVRKGQLESGLADIGKRIDHLKSSVKDIDAKIVVATRQRDEISGKITAIKQKYNMHDAADVDKQIELIDTSIDSIGQEIQSLRTTQQDHIRQQDRLEVQIESMDEKIESIKELTKAHKEEMKALQQQRLEFKSATLDLSKALSQDTAFNSELSTARGKLNKLKEEEARLQARSASIQERMGGDIAITKILENSSRLGDVHGTVASLGSVDSQYSLALEAAAGNKLKSIVVGDDATAAQCIKYLRETKTGVATFLPMNKIRSSPKEQEAIEAAKTRGCHGFAVDLVDAPSKYAKIFSFVLGSTLVVDSIDVARRIGVGKVKMVSLDGDIAERSGAMRGGFLKTKGRGSGFMEKELSAQMHSVSAQIADVEQLIILLEQKKTDNEEQIIRLRELKATLEGEIIKKEKSLHINADDLDVSTKLKDEFTAQLKEVRGQVDAINKSIMEKNKQLGVLKDKRLALRERIADLRNPSKLAELTTFEERLSVLKQEIMQLEGDKRNSLSQITNILNPEIENTTKIIKQHDKEQAQFVETSKTLKAEISQQQKELDGKEKQEAKFYAQFKEMFAQRNSLHKTVESLDEQIITLEEQIRDAERRNTVVSLDQARVKAELHALEQEKEQYSGIEPLRGDVDVSQLKRTITVLQNKLDAIGAVNMKALEVYDKAYDEYQRLIGKRDTLSTERLTIHEMINQIETRKKELFLRMFAIINANFKRIFSSLSAKGEAYLELESPDAPFDGGVRIKVRLSGTKFMDIRSLSGGEKTMTALAFIFAIQENDPAPFYIMDEVDAALDKRNSERLSRLIASYCSRAQYVVISHNDGVITAASHLYGVSMDQHGMSKVISLRV